MRRRKKGSYSGEADAEVAMSPLIDCVFLLLIFFLVTTMIKRKEKLIPISLPDQTSAVAKEPKDDTIIIGLDKEGKAFRVRGHAGNDGELIYEPLGDLVGYLKQLVDENGAEVFNRPLRIDCDGKAKFQTAIKVLDVCKLQGFTNVSVRTRGGRR